MGVTVARTRTVVWTMPVSSLDCRDGPILSHRRDRVTLSYDFLGPAGEYYWESVLFLGVAALAFTPHGACTWEQISASDRLIEVEGSAWHNTVRGMASNSAELRHLRIAFATTGCYDLLAIDFVPPPQGPPRMTASTLTTWA
jgi:hypothetical protein